MGPEDVRERLRRAYRRLLNPLIRILIRNGVTAPEVEELVRQVYVDAATSAEFQLPGRRLSDTRIAILTGLSRKEIHRLRTEGTRKLGESNLSRVGRVIAGWNHDPDFTGPYGLPLAIPFEDDPNIDAPSFTELVRRHSGDMAPRAMLDELLRTGLAEIHDDGLIRNTGRTYIPSRLDPAAIDRLGRVLARLADTLDFNNQVANPSLGRFERHVVTDFGLTEEQYEQFNIYLRQKCQQLLETLDNWIATQEGRLAGGARANRLPKKKLITGVGVYHFLDERLPFEDEYKD
ncbi:MAG TPA: DUF6502 family protein [Gammaproteobacteria bacterium]